MARTPQQPSSRKRKRAQYDDVAARPLRRSRRVAYREVFRLNDLPPELRNMIYSIAVRSEDSLELTGNLSPIAKALSQVSRAVRVESLGIYFSENDFHAYLSRYYAHRDLYYRSGIPQTEDWMILFGELATPRIRSLQLRLGHNVFVRNIVIGSLDFKNPLMRVTWAVPGCMDELRDWSRTFRGYNYVDPGFLVGVEDLALAVLRPQSQGNAVPTLESLRLFLTGVQVVTDWTKTTHPVNPTWLDLESQTESQLRNYIPHMLDSPHPGKQQQEIHSRNIATDFQSKCERFE